MSESKEFDGFQLSALTVEDLARDLDEGVKERRGRCSPGFWKFDDKAGVAHFATRCQGSNRSWNQQIRFLDWDSIQELEKQKKEEPEEEPEEDDEAEEEEPEEEPEEDDEAEEEEVEVEVEEGPEEEPEDEEEEGTEKKSSLTRTADWTDILEKHPELLESDVKVFCNCPAFKYWGYQYIMTELDTALSPENRYPDIRNKDLNGTVCKHLAAVFRRYF